MVSTSTSTPTPTPASVSWNRNNMEAKRRKDMSSCYLHKNKPVERICLHCNSGICNRCSNQDHGKYYCPHCITVIHQKRSIFKQTLAWSIITLALGSLLVGWVLWTKPPASKNTTSSQKKRTDANQTASKPKGLGALIPKAPTLPEPPKLTPIQQKIQAQLQTACAQKKKKACRKLAFFHVQTKGQRGYAQARSILQKACAWKDGESCAELAQMYHLGMGVTKDPSRAAMLYRMSCELSYRGACTNLGILYSQGQGLPQDGQKARKLFAKACQLKSALGCRNLAVAYFKGIGGTQSLSKARHFFLRACRYKDKAACFRLGVMFEKGLGVRRSHQKSKKYYKKACKLGLSQACKKEKGK